MDGYIKNKNIAIKKVRKSILNKYGFITFLILIFIPVWLIGMVAEQPPEKWTHDNIVFSHISRGPYIRYVGSPYLLNAQNGDRFVIKPRMVSIDDLSESLVPGRVYSIVYSNTIAGGDHIQALSDETTVYQDLNKSISKWKNKQKEMIIAIILTLLIEIIAIILIDRLWCKKEHLQIKKLKNDIKRREERTKNK